LPIALAEMLAGDVIKYVINILAGGLGYVTFPPRRIIIKLLYRSERFIERVISPRNHTGTSSK